MAAWQPAVQPWRSPGEDVLKKLTSGNATQATINLVLHCSNDDYASLVPTIERRLREEDIEETDNLGSTQKRQTVNAIAKDLINNSEHQQMLQWAQTQGESSKNVIAAVASAIRQVHAAAKRRSNRRIKSEPRESSAAASASTAQSQHQSAQSSGTKPSESTIKTRDSPAPPSPVKLDSYIVKLTIPGSTTVDPSINYFIAIPRAHGADEKLHLMQKETQKRLADKTQQFLLAEPQPDHTKCICDDGTTFSMLLAENEANRTKLHLEVMFTHGTRNGSFRPSPAISDQSTMTNPSLHPVSRSISRPLQQSIESDLAPVTSTARDDRNRSNPVKSAPKKRVIRDESDNEMEKSATEHSPRKKPRVSSTKTSKAKHNNDFEMTKTPKKRHANKEPPRDASSSSSDHESDHEPQYESDHSNSQDLQDDHDSEMKLTEDFSDDMDQSEDEVVQSPPPVTNIVLDHHKIPPTDPPSWRDAGTLSGIGEIVLLSCYDNDPTQIGDKESKATAVPSNDSGEAVPTADDTDDDNDAEDDEDAAVQEMQKALQAHQDKMMHMDHQILREMCIFYQIDFDLAQQYDAVFTIMGMGRPLKVYQLYGAYFVLRSEAQGSVHSSVVSGNTIVADSPGFGKSATAADIIVSSKLLENAWAAVRTSRSSKDPTERAKHLPKGDASHPQAQDAKCPSQDTVPICCPCVDSGPSAKLRPTSGMTVFVVPTALLVNSVEEWYKQVDMESNLLGFNVHAQTTIEKGKKAQIAKLQFGEDVRNVDILGLYMDKSEAAKLYTVDDQKKLRELSGHVFFTTPASYKGSMVGTKIHNIPCGRFIRDEFHQEPSIKNRMMAWARELIIRRAKVKPRDTPKITQMSGTPIRLGAKDWVGIASLWSLCIILRSNGMALPAGISHEDLSNTKKWPAISQHIKDSFWKNVTPSGLIDMTVQWRKSPVAMKGR